jgi:hypothetical protein
MYCCVYSTMLNCWRWTKNCPKPVEFYSKNKFEKLVHFVGFIIRTVKIFRRFSIYYMRDRQKWLQYHYSYAFSLQKPQPGSRDPTRRAHLSVLVVCNGCRCDRQRSYLRSNSKVYKIYHMRLLLCVKSQCAKLGHVVW